MIEEFFKKYFVEPILFNLGYNPINTFVYAILLFISLIVIYKLFSQRLKISFDYNFFIAIIPFILFSSSLRVLEDVKIVSSIFLISPLAYLTIFSIFFLTLLFSILIQKTFSVDYKLSLFSFGSILFILTFSLHSIKQVLPLFYHIYFFIPIVFLLFLLSKEFSFFSNLNFIALTMQMFDSVSTFIAITFFNRIEQHFLPNFLITNFGSWIFPLSKFFVILLILFLIDKIEEDSNFKNFLKIIIATLGLGQGFRDLLNCLVV